MLRNRLYAFLTVSGLAVGMGCVMLLGLYVLDELSYDRYHRQTAHIYRLNVDLQWADNRFRLGMAPARMAPALREEYPEVSDVLRVKAGSEVLFSLPGKSLYAKEVIYADSTLFDFFDYRFLAGHPRRALASPRSVVLTRSLAMRLFGTTQAVGKTVTVKENLPLLVTGVVEDAPQNHHLRFQAILPYYNTEASEVRLDHWDAFSSMGYVLLRPGTERAQLEAKMPAFYRKYVAKALGDDGSGKVKFQISFQPLRDIHLRSGHLMGEENGGNVAYVYTFSAVGLFIFLIALVNYVNLATARSMGRAREVGIRKVVGSGFWQLVGQFLAESLLLTAFSLLLGVLLVQAVLPVFNVAAGKQLALPLWNAGTALFLLGLLLLTGLLSGIYPALVLTRFKPTEVLKGRLGAGPKGATLRKSLVVLQFSVSMVMIMATLVVYRQLQYMRRSGLGFNQEQVLVVSLKSPSVQGNAAALRRELLQNSAVLGVSRSNGLVGGGMNDKTTFSFYARGVEHPVSTEYFYVDDAFLPVMQIPLKEGRNFSPDLSLDTAEAVFINEAMLKRLGWKAASQGLIEVDTRKVPVTGVVKDFHLRSLHHQIEPLVLVYKKDRGDRLLVRVAAGRVPAALRHVKDAYRRVNANAPFEYTFLDEQFARQYQADERKGAIFLAFSGIAIFIACLGLFGLAAFSAGQRTKEIGIRKVLGASVGSLVGLLSRDFAKLLVLSFLIAAPVSWWAMNGWLEDFAYRIAVPWWVFALAGGLSLLVALLTVSYQSIRTALANPVDSLRSE
jgi:putative ABC transport system permease protein